MPILREIEVGDPLPRVTVNIEAAVSPREAIPQEVEALHEYILHHVREWFGADAGLVVVTSTEDEPGSED